LKEVSRVPMPVTGLRPVTNGVLELSTTCSCTDMRRPCLRTVPKEISSFSFQKRPKAHFTSVALSSIEVAMSVLPAGVSNRGSRLPYPNRPSLSEKVLLMFDFRSSCPRTTDPPTKRSRVIW
jgi:hypothetical protein